MSCLYGAGVDVFVENTTEAVVSEDGWESDRVHVQDSRSDDRSCAWSSRVDNSVCVYPGSKRLEGSVQLRPEAGFYTGRHGFELWRIWYVVNGRKETAHEIPSCR